ncbi:MAG: hypothetical protein ACRD0P_09880 [Stackebrandtia sp.]
MSDPHAYQRDQQQAYQRSHPSYRPVAVRVLTFIVGGIAAFVLLRLVFALLEANMGNPLVMLVSGVGDFFAWPFMNIFNMTDESLATIFNYGIAAVAYILIGVGIGTLFKKHS